MRKQCGIIIASVLLLAAGAQASVGWAQDFALGATNQVEWCGGIGSAAAINKVSYDQKQEFAGSYGHSASWQRNSGTIFQNASASGPFGPSVSTQTAGIKGQQVLVTTGGKFPGAMGMQTLGGTFTNSIVKPFGVGQVDGIQHFVGYQAQGATTPAGTGTQSQFVEVVQRGTVITGAKIDPKITSTVNMQLNQSQAVGGR